MTLLGNKRKGLEALSARPQKKAKQTVPSHQQFYSNIDRYDFVHFAPGDQYKKWENNFATLNKNKYLSKGMDMKKYNKQKDNLQHVASAYSEDIKNNIEQLKKEHANCPPGSPKERDYVLRLAALQRELKESESFAKLLTNVTHLVFKGRKRNSETAEYTTEHFLCYTKEQSVQIKRGKKLHGQPIKISVTQAK